MAKNGLKYPKSWAATGQNTWLKIDTKPLFQSKKKSFLKSIINLICLKLSSIPPTLINTSKKVISNKKRKIVNQKK
jgi:hypothetical protein